MARPGRLALVLAAALAASGTAVAERSKPKDLTPRAIVKMMERSKLVYTLHPLDALTDPPVSALGPALWPERMAALHLPRISKEAGGATLSEYPEGAEETEAIGAVEVLFAAKKYAEAETGYLDVVKRFPASYRGHLFLGDAYFVRGDHEKALWAYREAARLDPHPVLAPMFEGHALAELGRSGPALEAFVRALSLRAYHESTLKLTARYARQLGIEPLPGRFEPKGFARRDGERVDLYYGDGPHWLAWAACKAVWLAEPGFRAAGETSIWSSDEDRSCLINLLAVYADERDMGNVPREPYLDRALEIAEKKLLDELVVYEFGTRISPDSLLLLTSDHASLDIPRFVREFVLPKKATSPEVP